MALQAIAYASEAVPDLGTDGLERMVQRSITHNQLAGVTGLLLFDGRRFLQYIEGPDDGLAVIYSRIVYSRLHTDVIELARGSVSQRRMPYWSMRWIPVEDTQLKEAAFSDWTNLTRRKAGSRTSPNGVERLASLAAPYLV
ncbi:BLUF domain-containing protein [Stenotrophomonas rhizophila]|uniref:BLUF domain-containing protein n=1 Tax=Stenotrophomonas rhizophila TaxID=216778 RepID=UPI00201CE6A7|nr:BLUF domain-containing protein [Stenotrophomonas rhizophila]UQY87986.1 BLUF domain-containing protein [Stenotrophomonas rhizophila]